MTERLTNAKLGYHGLRLAFGISFFVHGAIRLPKLTEFAMGMAGQFDGTLLAGFPALSFAYLIPIAETLIGLSLVIGSRFVRWAAFAGCFLMGGIMIGTCVLEKWDALASQLIHLIVFYLILINPYTADSTEDANR